MNSTDLLQAAAEAAGAQDYPKSTLYVVATPIGNMADLTLRALHLLTLVDLVACEDTRHTAQLLSHWGLRKPLLALHEHNESEASQQVLEVLKKNQRVAYLTDAGTPAVSDPGAALVAAVHASGLRVCPLPGASSVLCALSAAGDLTHGGFTFHGFLPSKGSERELLLVQLLQSQTTQVLFEAPHRIESFARQLAEAAPMRKLTVCRELTKQFETIQILLAHQFPSWLESDAQQRRGEFVIVLHGLPKQKNEGTDPHVETCLLALLPHIPLKQAVQLTQQLTQVAKNKIYQRALELKQPEV